MSAATGFLRLLDRIAGYTIIAAMTGMVVVVSTQVVLRYVFNDSLDWAEDVGRLFFVWAIFLAIPVGVGRGGHIAIELLTTHLPAHVQRAMLRVVSLACAGMRAVVAWQSVVLVEQQWDELMTTVDLTVSLYMIPVAIGSVHATLHFLAITVRGAVLFDQGSAE